jgi:hypothetical integral membrane protein (TIGR02206 family)
MELFGPTHVALITAIIMAALIFSVGCRMMPEIAVPLRAMFAAVLAVNETAWWIYRYLHEGLQLQTNLPLQLCDATVWSTVIACATLNPAAVEFSYFAGIAGAGMALLQPSLMAPWPSWPAIYFFLDHGGTVCAIAVLIFGRAARLEYGAVWRAFTVLLIWAGVVGAADYLLNANYMYLRHKPDSASLLDFFGPWPQYIAITGLVAFVLFWILWIPARPSISARTASAARATFEG